MEFPQSVQEELGTYVYLLKDPETGEIFYVGKGTGNRVFDHAKAAKDSNAEAEKLSRIREIMCRGLEVQYEIIRHGMTEEQAFEVESALIDFIGLPDLANAVAGHDADTRGRMTVQEIIALYAAEPVTIAEPALLIIINKLFRRNMTPDELYEATRGNWVLGVSRNKARYAFAVYRGIVREVYRIQGWIPVHTRSPEQKRQDRWRFEGEVAGEMRHYISGNVEAYIKPGAQSPVKYVNC